MPVPPLTTIITLLFCGFPFPHTATLASPSPTPIPNRIISQDTDGNRLQASELGLSLVLPPQSIVTSQKAGNQPSYLIRDRSTEPRWSMRIARIVSKDAKPTAKKQIDSYILGLINQEKPFEILLNQRVILSDDKSNTPGSDGRNSDGKNSGGGGGGGHLCYLKLQSDDGQPFISGWLILPAGNQSFLTISIYTTPEHLDQLRPMFDASFASIELKTAREINQAHETALSQGASFLAGINENRLRTLLGRKQCLRIYKPATQSSDEAEIGWSMIEVLDAPRGMLSINRSPREYTAGEREHGFLIHMQARIIADRQRNIFFDMDGRYWMAWNQSEEQWSSKGTIRQGDAATTESETGVRTPPGASPPTLTVIKAASDRPVGQPFHWRLPDTYLSQPLAWMLGELLILSPEYSPRESITPSPRSFSFYFYHATAQDRQPRLSMRTDTWERAPDGSLQWLLTTRISGDASFSKTRYSPEGTLIRRISADGTIAETIELETLRRIWNRLGLKTGAGSH